MKFLKEKVLSMAKYQLDEIKRGRDGIKAKQNISLFHLLPKQHSTFEGLPIYCDNIVVQAITLSYGHTEPNAVLIDGKIFINDAFCKYSEAHKEAILFHELAHHQFQHKPNPILYPIQAGLGFGYGLQIEYEADAYSASKGANMLGALEYMYNTYPSYRNRAIRLRISRLRDICNV